MSNLREQLFDRNDQRGAGTRGRNDWRLIDRLGGEGSGNHRLGFEPFSEPNRSDARQSLRDVARPSSVLSQTPASLLSQTIEQDVIPRLALAARPALVVSAGLRRPGSAEILQLTDLALASDAAGVADCVTEMALDGMPAETMFVDLLTPVARRLGELWEADLCDFTQVTIGIMRLQRAMRELTPAFHDTVRLEPVATLAGHHALLVPTPGEQHSFGLVMVAEYFRRAGWSVSGGAALSSAQLSKLVRARHYAVIGLSVGSERQLDVLTACIRQIRLTSRNQSIGVLVGGPLFIEQPDLVARVGADATAIDGRDAVRQALRLTAIPA
jgi:methanogenic corrinoid protein MtbC1